MFSFGAKSLSYCQHVDPRLMMVARLAISRSVLDFGMTEDQSRTEAQQRAKVAAGFSKTMDSPHRIQADGFSKALDLVPWVDGKFQWGDAQWMVQPVGGPRIAAFMEIASAMQSAASELGEPIRWGGVWDRSLGQLASGADGLAAELEAYKARHGGPDFLDGPHFELVNK
jgi:peptidoglycan L-alanyl-D-glutamate endopeptidase CwlK